MAARAGAIVPRLDAVLDAVLARRVEVLEERVAHLERAAAVPPLRRVDRQLLEALRAALPAGVAFSAGEVLDFARVSPDLATALSEARLTRVNAIGRRLGRLERAGAVVVVDRDNGGQVYTLAA